MVCFQVKVSNQRKHVPLASPLSVLNASPQNLYHIRENSTSLPTCDVDGPCTVGIRIRRPVGRTCYPNLFFVRLNSSDGDACEDFGFKLTSKKPEYAFLAKEAEGPTWSETAICEANNRILLPAIGWKDVRYMMSSFELAACLGSAFSGG